jgi:hypothetical protein
MKPSLVGNFFSVVARSIDVISRVVQWPVGIAFEMAVIYGLWQFEEVYS